MRLALFALAYAAAPAFAQEVAPVPPRIVDTVNELIAEAETDDVGLNFVRDLTTQVGQRLAGSAAEKRARDWSAVELQSLGFRNVRVEDFEIPFWSRVSDSASIVSPSPQDLVVTALGG